MGYGPEDVLEYFFDQISRQPDNREHLIQEFDQYYFKTRPKLSQATIRTILYGDLDSVMAL